ncbi:flavoprotein [Endozoicomonas sp. OPT23]|uniref:FAD-dependent oxidoreductase n=1 Tax=Endozoicomonas sp. OPT23 TaxID=2072845 RepID=UPI00129A752D|nr:FAD-dependent oxidoreductase [Endozoicomonas sp. OPT23]MRI33449.1 flavoprotein [Endozoicomonas sp. OPT23]
MKVQAVSGKTLPTEPRELSEVADWFAETDVVVVGLGAAGSCAAIEAADAGAKVMVLEAGSVGGGTTAMAGGQIYFGGGTLLQSECGFEDTLEDMYQFMVKSCGPNGDEEKIRLYVDNNLDHYQWLLDQGMEFKAEYYAEKYTNTPNDEGLICSGNEYAYPYDTIAKPAPRGHKGKAHGEDGGAYLMRTLTAALEKRQVLISYESRALTLIQDDSKRVVGLVVRIDGEERCIKAAQGVILCAGGFIMNDEMVKNHAPRLAKASLPLGNPNDNGVGLRMGQGVGGSLIGMSEGFVALPFYPPSSFVDGIIVNGKGQRVINEDSYQGVVGDLILNAPDEKFYLVIDSRNFEALEKPPLGGFGVAGVGETIEELEEELNMPARSLSHTLEQFNFHAAEGNDPLFHKRKPYLKPLNEAPYAAFDISINSGAYFPVFTFGGLNTQPTGEVLTEDRQVVTGLYAAGRNTCGLPRSGATYSSGFSIGDATFFGRLAGKTAAQNTK